MEGREEEGRKEKGFVCPFVTALIFVILHSFFCPRLFPLISSPSEMGASLLFAQGKHLSQLPISFTQHPPSPAHTCSLPFGFMSYLPASPDSLHIFSSLLPKPLPSSSFVKGFPACCIQRHLQKLECSFSMEVAVRLFLFALKVVCSDLIYTLNFSKLTSCGGGPASFVSSHSPGGRFLTNWLLPFRELVPVYPSTWNNQMAESSLTRIQSLTKTTVNLQKIFRSHASGKGLRIRVDKEYLNNKQPHQKNRQDLEWIFLQKDIQKRDIHYCYYYY